MKKLIPHLSFVVGLFLIVSASMNAKEIPGTRPEKKTFSKSAGTPNATLLNINRMSSWYESNGTQENNPNTGNSGLTYPRGTSTAIYSSGIMWGGISTDGISPNPRVNGQAYYVTTQPGAILGSRTNATENPNDGEVRLWRIRRDYATADLRQDAAEVNSVPLSQVSDGQIAAVRDQYKLDWEKWPWKKGAPFNDTGYFNATGVKVNAGNHILDWGEDINKNGVLDDGEDANGNGSLDAESPGVADADQVIWYVANDIRGGNSPWQTPPLGLELQVTLWGYNRTDALGNMIFKKFKLIYKGVAATPVGSLINNMYLCQWSDPDLGDAGDDFAGCDIDLSLGFVYNSKTLDGEYRKFNLAPPASGYDFLQGPMVDSIGSTAVFDLKIRQDKRNLPMTSFIYFAAGGTYSDPGATLNGSLQWYSMLQGLPPTPQPLPYPPPFPDPVTGLPTSFWLSGDPVKGTGWIDGNLDAAGDRRILLTSGPFTMALGDTQELVSAVLAGLGSDRLSSISVLKFYDKTAQAAYNNLFDLPKPPPSPKYTFVELNKGIILEWERDEAGRKATEESDSKGFKFEGYNVYQLPSATSPLSNAKKLGTYDLITDPSTVSQDEFDEASGQILTKPVQLGKNLGLNRFLYITQDAIRNKPLVNGQQYYFAITAYNYNPDPSLVTKSYESSPEVIVAVPHQVNPGVVLPYSMNDTVGTISSTLVSGLNDASIGMVVFNPLLQKGNTFEVWYGGSGNTRNYTVVKTISGTDLATVTATLSATKQVPAINTLPNATGTGTFTINDAKTQVKYSVSFSGLTGPVTGAHIHAGAAGVNGPVVHPFTVVNNVISDGVWSIPDSLVDDFTAGNLYANIHTAINGGGEIRGQIADGLFLRSVLPNATNVIPPITSYTEHRLPNEGISLYVGPAPNGIKSLLQTAPTNGSVINVPNPDGVYSIVGPVDPMVGLKATESNVEIRFVGGVNYAVAIRGDVTPTGANTRFIQVPFAAYLDTTRVWPVVKVYNATDSIWSADNSNPILNGKFTFDIVAGVLDSVHEATSPRTNIAYYNPAYPSFPPNVNIWKNRLSNESNFVLKNITFVSENTSHSEPAIGTTVKFTTYKSVKIGNIRSFTLKSFKSGDVAAAKAEVSKVNVFPNPYYAVNTSERFRERRYITFSHLPQRATLRIFNLAGTLVTTLQKDSPSQFFDWDLTNHKGLPVASGIYLIYVDMGDLGTKVLKSAIIMEQQFLDNF